MLLEQGMLFKVVLFHETVHTHFSS